MLIYDPSHSLTMYYMTNGRPMAVKLIRCPDKILDILLNAPSSRWQNRVWVLFFDGFNEMNGTLIAIYDK